MVPAFKELSNCFWYVASFEFLSYFCSDERQRFNTLCGSGKLVVWKRPNPEISFC